MSMVNAKIDLEKVDLRQAYRGAGFVWDFAELNEAFQALWKGTKVIATFKEDNVTNYNRDMHIALFEAAVRDILKAAKLSL